MSFFNPFNGSNPFDFCSKKSNKDNNIFGSSKKSSYSISNGPFSSSVKSPFSSQFNYGSTTRPFPFGDGRETGLAENKHYGTKLNLNTYTADANTIFRRSK